MLKLKMYPAKNGDAFLINANGQHLLVDAGYASTHIDADHIGGLLVLFNDNGPPGRRRIEIDAVWHNSLRSLPYTAEGPCLGDHAGVLEAIKRRGFPVPPALAVNPIGAGQGSSLAKLLRTQGITGMMVTALARSITAVLLTPCSTSHQ